MRMAVNFWKKLIYGLLKELIVNVDLKHYQIISKNVRFTVFFISVVLILTAVSIATLSLILSVSINIQTVLVVIIYLILVL